MKAQVKSGELVGKGWFDPELGMPVETRIKLSATTLTSVQLPNLNTSGGGASHIINKTVQNYNFTYLEDGQIAESPAAPATAEAPKPPSNPDPPPVPPNP